MELSEIKQQLRDYLCKSFRLDSINDAQNIFEAGHINSLFFIQLLVFIEKTFDVQLEEGEFDIHKLTTINVISELVQTKLSSTIN